MTDALHIVTCDCGEVRHLCPDRQGRANAWVCVCGRTLHYDSKRGVWYYEVHDNGRTVEKKIKDMKVKP